MKNLLNLYNIIQLWIYIYKEVLTLKDTIKEVVNLLLENDKTMNNRDLSEQLGYSQRYILQIIKEIKDDSEKNGFYIEQDSSKRYCLKITNESLFKKRIDSLRENEEITQKVLQMLVDYNEYIKIEDIADHFYMSRSNMDRIIKSVKIIAKQYDLVIISRPKYGIKIHGTEMNKRICSAHLSATRDVHEEETLKIQNILYEVLQQFQYSISDMSFHNLVYHIFILIKRIRAGYEIMEDIQLKQEYRLQNDIATNIICRLENCFDIKIPNAEKNYLVLHLLGKQLINRNQEIDEKTFELTNKILEKIFKKRNIDLRNDLELKINMCLHLQPLLYRLRYHFTQSNPLLQRIKREMLVAYELALIAKEVIKEEYSLDLSEDEAAFLAMHFSLSLIKGKERKNDLKFLVVCSTGRGTARLLLYKLMEQYNIGEEDVVLTSLIQMKNMNLNSYSCVISTVPIPFEINIPVIMINPILDSKSSKKIDEFIKKKSTQTTDYIYRKELFFNEVQLKTKEEVLLFIERQCKKYYQDENVTYEDLFKREELSSTEVGNKCCMPHPVAYYPNQPIVIIIILPKPIKWLKERVKFIFFVALPKDFTESDDVLDEITSLVCNSDKLHKLSNDTSFESFIKIIRG